MVSSNDSYMQIRVLGSVTEEIKVKCSQLSEHNCIRKQSSGERKGEILNHTAVQDMELIS